MSENGFEASLLKPGDLVLWIGDSITHAFRKPNEINDAFQLGAGFAMMAAARLKLDHPRAGLAFINRGKCGDTLAALQERWQRDCLELQPTVISLLIGVNDAIGQHRGQGGDPTDFADRLLRLLAQTRTALPGVKMVLCAPFVFELEPGPAEPGVRPLVEARAAAVGEAAEQVDARFVPLQPVFDKVADDAPDYWLYDGVHPTAAGHGLIARTWLQIVHDGGV